MSGEIKKSTSYHLYENRLYEYIGYSPTHLSRTTLYGCK